MAAFKEINWENEERKLEPDTIESGKITLLDVSWPLALFNNNNEHFLEKLHVISTK